MTNNPHETTSWHSSSSEFVFKILNSSPEGLSEEEAVARLSRHGPNRLTPPKKRGPFIRFISQFNNVLIYVLLAAAAITAAMSHWVDTWVIAGVVLLNAFVGFVQEGKAEKALDAIKNMLSHKATVLRGGHRIMIQAENVVPGDVVFLQSGDKVPADMRLFKTKDLRVDEATLTGESMPVDKSIAAASEMAIVGDRKCMAYSGTLVTYGQGSGVIVATGDATEIGKISSMIASVQPLTTRLLIQMQEFGRLLTFAILTAAAATFAFGFLVHNYSAGMMFLAAVGLAVAAIPEGLPAIITVTLAMGVQRMAHRNAIIRRLPAVETLGSVTVICSDKTGTLTKNEMTVRTVITARQTFDVSGVGYDPHGYFSIGGIDVSASDFPLLAEIARTAILCNDASVNEVDGRWMLQGDPTEGALISLGMKSGLNVAVENEKFPRIDTIPFESQQRFMATLHHDHAGHCFIYLKGAPEKVLEMCSRQMAVGEDMPLNHLYWHEQMTEIASRGQRIIAIAFKAADVNNRQLAADDLESGLTLLGIVGIIDPPRETAIEAVKKCHDAGIKVKMITGDHAVTAMAIGSMMGIGGGGKVITGQQIDAMSDDELRIASEKADIFARVSPEHKLQLVQSLQANGEITAMTGDGVNDAPALKRSDVGIAMGLKGTEVSKEAAEIVLADDNFTSIVHAVEEGRTVYDNIKKAITFILPTNAAEAGIIIAAIISGRALPITPVQILWVNMITAVTLALALTFEKPESDVMKRPPRNPKEPILSGFLIWRIFFVAIIVIMATFGLFMRDRLNGYSLEHARTIAVNTIIFFEIFYLLNTRYLKSSNLSLNGLLGNRYVLAAIGVTILLQILFTHVSFMQTMFSTTHISNADWLRIVTVSSSVFFIVEIEKYFFARYALIKKK